MTSREAHDTLVRSLRVIRSFMADAGVALAQLQNEYHEVDGFTGTWADYLHDPNIGLSVREANELIGVGQYVLEHGQDVLDINTRNLKYLVRKNINDEELINDARYLSPKDFKEIHYTKKTKSEDRTYTYMVMRRINETGTLEKVHGVESDEVLEALGTKINGQ